MFGYNVNDVTSYPAVAKAPLLGGSAIPYSKTGGQTSRVNPASARKMLIRSSAIIRAGWRLQGASIELPGGA